MNSWRAWALTLSFFAAGCTCGAFDPQTTRFACSTSDECGPGSVCNGVECVAATAGGVDAGVDRDGDGVFFPADCDDGNPAVFPGSVEACSNGLDDDCDRTIDCEDPGCDGLACAGGGTCLASICRAQTEVLCADGVDNDLDGKIDCADADCPTGAGCDDQNPCTTGERCVADGRCEKRADVTCNMPPGLCFDVAGACRPDAGCVYGPKLGGCDDGLACTLADSCASSGACSGAPRSCGPSPNVCLSAGTCREPTGTCVYTPRVSGACNDGQRCTVNDSCDGDGGCRGTPVVCTPPSQCHQTSGTCSAEGACQFTVRAGACDAGTGAGTCNSSFACVPSPRFPYQPSNFVEADLPDAGTDFTVGCAIVIDTTTPSLLGGSCATLPAFTVINPAGAEPTVLFLVNDFTVSLGASFEVRGSRPAIFAVLGNVDIAGQIIVGNAAGTSPACGNGGTGFKSPGGQGNGGGGGGGFGTAGGVGGSSNNAGAGAAGISNGTSTLIPLRGGCTGGEGGFGGAGAVGAGGKGGGALQISAVGSLSINGLVAAFGRGGGAPTFSQYSGGGGGGSGGALLFEGQTVALGQNARVVANGGGGSEAGSGANPGTDGRLDAQPAAGGSGGAAGSGNGGAGGAGTLLPLSGLPGGNADQGGGGGGGAVGRIRINASTSCSYLAGSLLSPPATSNGACP